MSTQTPKSLHATAHGSIGKRVWFKGTNANEYVKETFGRPEQGHGVVLSVSDSHGLCVMIRQDDGFELWVEPTELTIQVAFGQLYRSIDDV